MNQINDRVLLSFDGECLYRCKHCYTYELPKNEMRSIEEIVESISNENFDVVYISQKNENFVDPNVGLDLCERIFEKYKTHIMLITRRVFNLEQSNRLLELHKKMKTNGKILFVGVSVIGMESSTISERVDVIPSTSQRLDFAKKVYHMGIESLLLVRPLFPHKIIPRTEIEQIIDYVAGQISCVLTGALMVNEYILERLGISEKDLNYIDGGESEYLSGAISETMKFVDVLEEIKHLKKYCSKRGVPFFEHSMPALRYLSSLYEEERVAISV